MGEDPAVPGRPTRGALLLAYRGGPQDPRVGRVGSGNRKGRAGASPGGNRILNTHTRTPGLEEAAGGATVTPGAVSSLKRGSLVSLNPGPTGAPGCLESRRQVGQAPQTSRPPTLQLKPKESRSTPSFDAASLAQGWRLSPGQAERRFSSHPRGGRPGTRRHPGSTSQPKTRGQQTSTWS